MNDLFSPFNAEAEAPKRAHLPFWPIALCFGVPFLLALAIAWRYL